MKNLKTARLGLSMLCLMMIVGGVRGAGGHDASTPPATAYPRRAAISRVARDVAAAGIVAGGNVITQTLTLHAGWNAIYLEVEPRNPAPLVNAGTEEEPIWVHAQPTMKAIFAQLACEDCLESVWAWHVPFSTQDYIVDPAEGLWDEPGWKRYFPATSVGPDGVSRAFLTDLLSLHTNTGYLVKLADDLAAPLTLQVTGPTVVENQRWVKDSYNLAGFPIFPAANPTVAAFFGGSPVTEVRYLTPDGHWEKLAATDTLVHAQSYLVYYDGQVTGAPAGFTAPLSIPESVPDEIQFAPGAGGNRQTIPVENLSVIPITVTCAFADGDAGGIPLYYEDDATEPPTYIDLRANAVQVPLAPGEMRNIVLVFIPDESPMARAAQTADAGARQAVLVIASFEGGTRWMIPLTFESSDMRGLWVGDVLINDVSEARLGATNADQGALTIALRPRNTSGIYGATEFKEIIDGNTALVAIQTTLDLNRSAQVVTPTLAMMGRAPYVAGYVFEDANQNGERDPTEPGFGGITVTLAAGNFITATQTLTDGAYIFAGLMPGKYALALAPATPSGTTATFDVTPPLTTTNALVANSQPNAWPVQVTVDASGITGLEREDYDGYAQTVAGLPYYNAADQRVEPRLNFGFVSVYDASLWTGVCTERLEKRRELGQMVNGSLAITIARASLNPPPGAQPVDDQLLSDANDYAVYIAAPDGTGRACGEIVVGAQTIFTDGRGSEFRFRILLRLDDVAQGQAALLPRYTAADGVRTSSAAFSLPSPLAAHDSGTEDGITSLKFAIAIDYQDPLNPFKHKYHPDHDNLDAQFIPIDPDAVPPHLWESYDIRRDIQLEFTDLPPMDTLTDTTSLAQEVGWGGVMWGGYYQEVIRGLHKHDITVSGIFIIRHVLPLEQMVPQPYDE